MCKGLFEDTKPRHSLQINRKGKSKKIQDTPKENNILCTNCEKRIEIIETFFARKIIDIHNYNNLKERFKLSKQGNQEYLICENINPSLFKLFVYSLVWRSSISNLVEFEKFKIDNQIEEEIRSFLNQNLATTQKQLNENIEINTSYPSYHFCVIKPLIKSNLSRGIFTVYNAGEKIHLLMLVDFAIFFYSDENSVDTTLKLYSNKQNEKVLIALGDIERWKELNKTIVSKMLN